MVFEEATWRRVCPEEEGMEKMLRNLWRDEEGQDLTEYGLLLVLVALAAIATMQSLASALSNVFSNASSSLSTST
jgi:pilus assembly protein Flp/PilA